jgi:hypothetical protein
LVDNGQKNDDQAMGAFHHEFSSLLMLSNNFNSKAWTDHNPKDFKYLYDAYGNWKEMKESTKAYTDEDCYNNGFVSGYGLSVLENDFNEYSRMIFTYPKKFNKIMDQYPRVRGKFKVWLEFYQEINPIFTEEYLLGK